MLYMYIVPWIVPSNSFSESVQFIQWAFHIKEIIRNCNKDCTLADQHPHIREWRVVYTRGNSQVTVGGFLATKSNISQTGVPTPPNSWSRRGDVLERHDGERQVRHWIGHGKVQTLLINENAKCYMCVCTRYAKQENCIPFFLFGFLYFTFLVPFLLIIGLTLI